MQREGCTFRVEEQAVEAAIGQAGGRNDDSRSERCRTHGHVGHIMDLHIWNPSGNGILICHRHHSARDSFTYTDFHVRLIRRTGRFQFPIEQLTVEPLRTLHIGRMQLHITERVPHNMLQTLLSLHYAYSLTSSLQDASSYGLLFRVRVGLS